MLSSYPIPKHSQIKHPPLPIACSACPCAYLEPIHEIPPTRTKTLNCQCISDVLLIVKSYLQRGLKIIIPIIITVGSTIIVPATTIFASVSITHAFFFYKSLVHFFVLLCYPSFTLGSDSESLLSHFRQQSYRIFFFLHSVLKFRKWLLLVTEDQQGGFSLLCNIKV